MALPTTLDGRVYVSLDGSGNFDGPSDRLVHSVREFVVDEGRDGAQQLNPPKVQSGHVLLRNENGQYSPDNAASAYYQRLIQGRPVLYQAKHGDRRTYRSHVAYRDHLYYRGAGVWTLGRHVVDDIEQETAIGSRTATLSTLGYELVLTKSKVTIPLMTTPLVSECFTAYLDAVGWPADKRDIAISDTRLLYYWADEQAPWTGMLELLGAEGPGAFGVRRDGTFYFENRNYRATTARSTTSQVHFYDRATVGGVVFEDFKPANALQSVYNRATYTTRRRQVLPLDKVWEHGAQLTLAPGEVRILFARPADLYQNAEAPREGTDYHVSSGSATVALTYTSGFVAFIQITAGGSGAVIDGVTSQGIQFRAQSLPVLDETTVQNTVDASASIARFSTMPGQNIPRVLSVQGWADIDIPSAQGVCDSWVTRQMFPRVSATIKIRDLEQILRRQVSDRITLTHVQSGISADFWINAGELRVADAQGRTVEYWPKIEKCDAITGAVWDGVTSIWDDPSTVWGI